jgi:hypothetical protein
MCHRPLHCAQAHQDVLLLSESVRYANSGARMPPDGIGPWFSRPSGDMRRVAGVISHHPPSAIPSCTMVRRLPNPAAIRTVPLRHDLGAGIAFANRLPSSGAPTLTPSGVLAG